MRKAAGACVRLAYGSGHGGAPFSTPLTRFIFGQPRKTVAPITPSCACIHLLPNCVRRAPPASSLSVHLVCLSVRLSAWGGVGHGHCAPPSPVSLRDLRRPLPPSTACPIGPVFGQGHPFQSDGRPGVCRAYSVYRCTNVLVSALPVFCCVSPKLRPARAGSSPSTGTMRIWLRQRLH